MAKVDLREEVMAAIGEAGGFGLVITALDGGRGAEPRALGPGLVHLAIHRRGPLPVEGLERFDLLLCADPDAPHPWVGVAPGRFDDVLDQLQQAVARQPIAAAVTAQILRTTLQVTFGQALVSESTAYSMLLGSEDFRMWRAQRPVRARDEDGAPRVLFDRDAERIHLRLNRPEARNAFDNRMRDALYDALESAILDPDDLPVLLTGEGPAFSAGGDLDEFGRADDPGRAHLIRALRAPTRLINQIRDRVTARVHGACIGAGIEVPAAAGHVIAHPDAIFRLPEMSMGLIPGAGGTVTVPRRIGRQRTCFMSLSGTDVNARTALAWGLVDMLEPS